MHLTQLTAIDLSSLGTGSPAVNYIIDLSQLSLISVSGDDADSFLQAQFSNDLNLLETTRCQLHAYCNPKGRTLAVIRIMRKDNGFWMVVPENIHESLINRLRMYVLRAKVTIELDGSHVMFGMIGNTDQLRSEAFRFRVNSTGPRHIIIDKSEHSEEISKSNNLQLCHSDLWRWLDIQSGIPQVYSQTSETFIPQTINLELVDAISFRKGCFPGQEIVARIKYLGKPKQRMVIGTVVSAGTIVPGDEIFVPEKPDQKSGLVVDAVKTGGNQYQLSAMIPASMVEQGDLRVGSAAGPVLNRTTLPYAIP